MTEPKIKPMTPEETKTEWQSLLDGVKRISEQPLDKVVYRCPLCSIEIGQNQDSYTIHLAQKHSPLELAVYISEEDYRHDD